MPMSNRPIDIDNKEINDTWRVGNVNRLGHIRKTPTVLYGIFTEIIRQFYKGVPIEGRPIWSPYKVWSQYDDTEIWIDTELRWEDKQPEFRPAIYIKLSDISYQSLTGRSDGKMANNPDGTIDFSRSGNGNVTFVHIAETASEACVLADTTMDYLDAVGMAIRDDFCFSKFHLVGRSALQQRPRESKDRIQSSVICEFNFQDSWTLQLESQVLRRLVVNARQSQ